MCKRLRVQIQFNIKEVLAPPSLPADILLEAQLNFVMLSSWLQKCWEERLVYNPKH